MFSVIIPIYNHARYLRDAVASCLTSALVVEILLADDGSTDESAGIAADLANAYPDRVRNLSETTPKNVGAHNRLNQLCRAATQPWLAVLNSDDLFAAHRFDLIQQLARLYNVDFVAGSMLIINEEGRFIGSKRGISQPEYPCPQGPDHDGPLLNDELRMLLCSQNFIATTSNMAFRKSLFLRIGGFADLRYAHDWDFALRATMQGKCLWTPNITTYYRVHSRNTISEVSPHMDGEITRLFCRFLADYPNIEQDPKIQQGLASNQHITPYSAPSPIVIPDRLPTQPLLDEYVFPSELPRRARLNALLGIHYFSYDFVLLSMELDELPVVHCSTLEQALVRRATPIPPGAEATPQQLGKRGRLMRIPGAAKAPLVIDDVRSLPGWGDVRLDGANLLIGESSFVEDLQPVAEQKELAALLTDPAGKPTCLVLPIFMAVGGVERNTVEMIRQLRADYHFVVVTTERLAKAQGSLHYQLDELEVPTIDLAEIGGREHHVALLSIIAQALTPDLVWICNGSPWLVEHAVELRRMFAKCPIVDQQVYDTDQGWIQHYHHKGIQSFDHYIAINARIREKFVRKLRIPPHRVSLIYSAINSDRIQSCRVPADEVAAARMKLGLAPSDGHLFSFIGRLTEQKRPILFLEIARLSLLRGSTDRFLLVGDGGMRDLCLNFIRDHGLTNVLHLPFSSQTPHLLALCDGLIVTSEYEGLPIVMLEALAVGTPVLATDVGDIKLILDDYRSGSSISVNADSDSVGTAFTEWIFHLSEYKTQAMKARDAVLERFASATTAAAYLKCFEACRQAYANESPMPSSKC